MPFIDLRTTVPAAPEQREALKAAFGQAITALHKTETYLMVLHPGQRRALAGRPEAGQRRLCGRQPLRLGLLRRLQPDDRPCLRHPVPAPRHPAQGRLRHLPPRQRLGLERAQLLRLTARKTAHSKTAPSSETPRMGGGFRFSSQALRARALSVMSLCSMPPPPHAGEAPLSVSPPLRASRQLSRGESQVYARG